jgi:alkylation response protein AidB-like acyl-CoA dehydrogenase
MAAFASEERQLLHDSLHDFLSDRYTFEHQLAIARADDGDGFGRAEWATYAEMGWLGVALPEPSGGAGGGMTELAIILAAGGHYLVLEPLISTLVTGAGAIADAGTPEQAGKLADIASGKLILAFCHGEPDAGYARDHVTVAAVPDGSGYVLSGKKGFALHAHAADELVVSARVGGGDGPVGLFLVPRVSPGVAINRAPAIDGRPGAEVAFEGVRLGGEARLGGADAPDCLALIGSLIDRGAIAVCAESVGAMAAVTEQTVTYLKTREQFGQTLSKFQVLQHRAVEMSVATEEARAIVHAALQAIDDGRSDAQLATWRAKVQTARAARFVGSQAIQLHGGMGMTDELAIGHYYKRLSMNQVLFGDAEWYLKLLSANVAA